MTIADLAGPVLMQVLPTTFAVLLATSAAAALPLLLPRFVTWLKGPQPVAAPHRPAGHHVAPPHTATHHADHAGEHEHTYSI